MAADSEVHPHVFGSVLRRASRRGNCESGICAMGPDKGYDQKEFVIGSQ